MKIKSRSYWSEFERPNVIDRYSKFSLREGRQLKDILVLESLNEIDSLKQNKDALLLSLVLAGPL